MDAVLQEIAQFFYQVEGTTQDLGIPIQVEMPIYEQFALATFRGTQHRYHGPPASRFLARRKSAMEESRDNEAPPAGGIWLGDDQLFDFALSVEQNSSETTIERCDCGFYGRWETGEKVVDVALRYEADFLGIGSLWAAHPTFHLQWDSVASGRKSGATEVRQRVDRMLPTHFFEFCTRHFARDIWKSVFSPAAGEIEARTELIHEETEGADDDERRNKFDIYFPEVQQWTEEITDSCRIEPTYEWTSDEVCALPL